jgi:hypothetical protein
LGYSMLRNRLLSVVLMAVFISGAAICAAESEEYWMYVGTYTSGGSRGIYPFRFGVAGGELFPAGEATRISNPSFLALHPNNRYLYSVSEVSSFQGKNGAIAAFLIDDKTGALTFLNTVSSEGGDPSHLAVDKTGKWLATANYKTGSVSVFPVAGDGKWAAALRPCNIADRQGRGTPGRSPCALRQFFSGQPIPAGIRPWPRQDNDLPVRFHKGNACPQRPSFRHACSRGGSAPPVLSSQRPVCVPGQ